MNIGRYEEMVPSAKPAFFLAQTTGSSDAALAEATTTFAQGPGAVGTLQVDTRLAALAKDQSSLAALNVGGLIRLVSAFALAMGTVTIAIFVFALMLQRRREYITLRALGMQPTAIRSLIAAEAGTAAVAGCAVGVPVGLLMAYYLVNVLRPLFVLNPPYLIPFASLVLVAASILLATAVTALAASSLAVPLPFADAGQRTRRQCRITQQSKRSGNKMFVDSAYAATGGLEHAAPRPV